ncbi:MAG: 1-deoxy-D-xylulose-5-phosphate synthase [Candidatus Omnitrophota bacterium]
MSGYLENISSPREIRQLSREQLKELAAEIRREILTVTSGKGGHLASSLGAVEIAIALHYCMDSPRDKIIWDVGHQAYAHKLLTGRYKNFGTLRELGGLSGFPRASESEHDPFTSGHSSTSISLALGMASARDIEKQDYKVAAVIGDASLSTGLAFEGMNNAGHIKNNLMVVLNDNEHSISKPVGALSRYLNNVIANPLYNRVRNEAEKILKGIPRLGPTALKTVKKFQEGLKNLIVPGILFEELGFRYFGPIDGHDINQLISIFQKILSLNEPVIVHTVTKKGKGYVYAEQNPTKFHGVSMFDLETGQICTDGKEGGKSFTEYFSDKLAALAGKDKRVAAITAAMPDGTGLTKFAGEFPERFFDVGITEPHAVTFAAGLAKGGMRPVVAVYSTFLQRSYDQLIHDVALQNLPVVFCLDRAGLVGEDGPTHHGVFDISYTRGLPNFTVMAPKDGPELEAMLEEALKMDTPVVIRYPRAKAVRKVSSSSCAPIKSFSAEYLREGDDIYIIALGSMVNAALEAADLLSKSGIETGVINARFARPLDKAMIRKAAEKAKRIYTIEEGIIAGGFGSAVLEEISSSGIRDVKVRCLGLPDEFIEHGKREELLRKYHLTPDEIAAIIKSETEN